MKMTPSLTKKSIYILCTGGTIAMQKTSEGYAAKPGYMIEAMKKIPELNNQDMPHYTIEEYEQPIDSANMTPDDWEKIGSSILANYDKHDAFVVLHGTDTMAYTASALSFMFNHLNKPIILTGSQLPLFETRNDARENLINAMLIASHYAIPEVCIFFNNKLFRGNRSKKMDASSFSAFASPNFPALGKVGTDILIRKQLLQPLHDEKIFLQSLVKTVIISLKMFPGMSHDILAKILQAPLQAVVIETYGLGTATEDENFLKVIQSASDSGIIIVNCSQCATAKVKMSTYAAGNALKNAGVISGGDMTSEAALAKLFYLFSLKISLSEIKSRMQENLRGELTI
ncbi:MAG: asparaginase [Gammaproteobacteria bacterium]|nr:asparaginase [Gammaproteobacteria bacterium]